MPIVTLNVGGTRFQTTTDTLLMHPTTYFGALLRATDNVDRYEQFIDRDPSHFRHVLNFLRGSPSLPCTMNDMDELEQEAHFYCMPDLVRDVRVGRQSCERPLAHYMEKIASSLG